MAISFVNTASKVQDLLQELVLLPSPDVNLFLDVEGTNLCRFGSVSIFTLHERRSGNTHLVDITTLGKDAFTVAAGYENSAQTLTSILENPDIIKVFFDVRNDSNALFHLYGSRFAGVHDLQLMELATRDFSKRVLCGLAKCVEYDAGLGYTNLLTWKRIKAAGVKLFNSSTEGSHAVFDKRSLPDALKAYCAQDVTYMLMLYRAYCSKLCDIW
jgi:exonuclease 3'-5' domain-containing protein 1